MGILAAATDTPVEEDNKPWEERPVHLEPLEHPARQAHQEEDRTDPGAGTGPAQAAA